MRWLERLDESSSEIRERLRSSPTPINSLVSLATCNRFELYFDGEDVTGSLATIVAAIADELNEKKDLVAQSLTTLTGIDAVEHLFSVASGLDSMIIGESEIAGQVRRALTHAQKSEPLSPAIQQLFQNALRVSKMVANQTGVGVSGKSVITSALNVAAPMTFRQPPDQVLIIGTGAYARVVTAFFKNSGAEDIAVFSRSGRAEYFAKTHGIRPISSSGLVHALAESDIVISASGNSGYAIDVDLISTARRFRTSEKNIVIIDVALSRDVAPGVGELPGCFVLDLDQLKELTPIEHSRSIEIAREIVSTEAVNFESEQRAKTVDPVVAALRSHFAKWIDKEIDTVKNKLDADTVAEIRKSLSRVSNAVLHKPTLQAREFALSGNNADYVQAVKVLFDIELGRDV
jgi:glutamyl-tRNA reductase